MLSEQLVKRIRDKFDMPVVNDNHDQTNDGENDEDLVAQSQDYPGLYQSKGKDTLKFCSLCDFSTRCVEEMDTHVLDHSECDVCKKKFKTEAELQNHLKMHESNKCQICGKEVLSKDKVNHDNMHDKHKKQVKGMEKGKVTKTKKTNKNDRIQRIRQRKVCRNQWRTQRIVKCGNNETGCRKMEEHVQGGPKTLPTILRSVLFVG